MGHITQVEGFRVVIEPKDIHGREFSEAESRRACEEIIAQVRKHVDGVGLVLMKYDESIVCEHCGWLWSETGDSPHNGGCCEKDILVYEKEEK